MNVSSGRRCISAICGRRAKARRLLWLQIGSDDPYLPLYKEFDAAMEKHHVKREFRVTEGTHAWPVWREYLSDFVPLLFR